jgi:2-methylaconitate cis-trans-isomerase PrpF
MASKPDIGLTSELLPWAANDEAVRCVVMRGGTSRGLFFHEQDLPSDPALRDKVIMGALGAPDPRQVDGLGGADMLLSKVAIVARSANTGADIDCEFANMTPGKDRPTYGTNCGNLVAAVALFAIEEGLVSADRDSPVVRIRNRNSGSLTDAHISTLDGRGKESFGLAGMPGTGACVDLDFLEPAGTTQSQLLPTGNARETIRLEDGRSVDVSIVDAGALYVFVKAKDLDLTATETAEQLQNTPGALDMLERLRAEAAKMLALVESTADAGLVTPDVPKLAFVGPAVSYRCDASSTEVQSESIDLVSRIVSSQKYHKAYAVTGAIATAAAATIEGSTVHEAVGGGQGTGLQEIRIGHPSGVMACEVESRVSAGNFDIVRARIKRTARRVSQGTVFVPSLV